MPIVSQQGTILENCCHWLVTSSLSGGDIGLANIYAPNKPLLCYQLWEQMIHQLSNLVRWILAVDFNMVEFRQDKTNPCDHLILVGKRGIFNAFKRHLGITEPPRSPDSLIFSCDNQCSDGSRILARLDRFNIFHSTSG